VPEANVAAMHDTLRHMPLEELHRLADATTEKRRAGSSKW